jgi:hypothetical protein
MVRGGRQSGQRCTRWWHGGRSLCGACIGTESACEALWRMDELYPQKSGDLWAVRTQLVMQLAAPPPYDLDSVDLAEYKGVQPPFNRWSNVAEVCGELSDWLLRACMEAVQADDSSAAKQARRKSWRGVAPPGKIE